MSQTPRKPTVAHLKISQFPHLPQFSILLSKFHLACTPYLIRDALLGFSRTNYLGLTSLRERFNVMDFICILDSYV